MKARNDETGRDVPELEGYLEALRAELGEAPSDAELLAYHRDELDSEASERIQEHLAVDPQVAERFAELSSYPSLAKPGDPDYLSDEDVEMQWQRFKASRPEELGRTGKVEPGPWSSGSIRVAYSLAAVAALFALGMSLAFWDRGRELERLRSAVESVGGGLPTTDFYAIELRGFDPTHGKSIPSPVDLPAGVAYYAFTLDLELSPGAGVGVDAEFRLEIWPARVDRTVRQEPLWQQDGLRISWLERITVLIPGMFLAPGIYELDLVLLGDQEALRARYLVSI